MTRALWKWMIAGVLGCSLFAAGCTRRAEPGERAPDFQVTTLQGLRVSPLSYRGHVVLVHFWASYCVPCIQETPDLTKLQADFGDGSVVVLGISIDEDANAYRRFLNQFHVNYPTALDPSQRIMHRYGTEQIPETYVIDREGRLARKLVNVAAWTSPEMVTYLRNLAAR